MSQVTPEQAIRYQRYAQEAVNAASAEDLLRFYDAHKAFHEAPLDAFAENRNSIRLFTELCLVMDELIVKYQEQMRVIECERNFAACRKHGLI